MEYPSVFNRNLPQTSVETVIKNKSPEFQTPKLAATSPKLTNSHWPQSQATAGFDDPISGMQADIRAGISSEQMEHAELARGPEGLGPSSFRLFLVQAQE